MSEEMIYFVTCAGRIKIGTTANLNQRMRSIATSAPDEIWLIGTIPGGRSVEARLHSELAKHRTNGEWFNDCPEVRQFIESLLGDPQTRKRFAPVLRKPPVYDLPPTVEIDSHTVFDGTLDRTSKRFAAMTPLIDAVIAARNEENQRGMARGTLISEIVDYSEFISALRVLDRMSGKFRKLIHQSMIRLVAEQSQDGIAEAADVLARRAEDAFRPLKIKRAALQIKFVEAA